MDLKKFMSKSGSKGLPGGPNEIKFSVEGYKSDSPDRFNPYNVIDSNHITMKGVNHPVYGQDDQGNGQMMYPGNDYIFPGSQVFEIPMAQQGLQALPSKDQLANDPELRGWNEFNTPLEESEKAAFAEWMQATGVNPWDRGAYDVQGYWKDQVKGKGEDLVDSRGHRPDTYKKPNHPTFSMQSKYADNNPAGIWMDDGTYMAPSTHKDLYSKEYYDRMFGSEEGIEHFGNYMLPEVEVTPDYEEMELTDEEIEEMRKGGYVVEEIPQAQDGLATRADSLNIYQEGLDVLDRIAEIPRVSDRYAEIHGPHKVSADLYKKAYKTPTFNLVPPSQAETQNYLKTIKNKIDNLSSYMYTDALKNKDKERAIGFLKDTYNLTKHAYDKGMYPVEFLESVNIIGQFEPNIRYPEFAKPKEIPSKSASSLARKAKRDALTQEMKEAGFTGYSAREVMKEGSEGNKKWKEFLSKNNAAGTIGTASGVEPENADQLAKEYKERMGDDWQKKTEWGTLVGKGDNYMYEPETLDDDFVKKVQNAGGYISNGIVVMPKDKVQLSPSGLTPVEAYEAMPLPEGYSKKYNPTRDGDPFDYFRFDPTTGKDKRITNAEFVEATNDPEAILKEKLQDGGQRNLERISTEELAGYDAFARDLADTDKRDAYATAIAEENLKAGLRPDGSPISDWRRKGFNNPDDYYKWLKTDETGKDLYNMTMDTWYEMTGIPSAKRIYNDPWGTVKGVGNTLADLAYASNTPMGMGVNTTNPFTGNEMWTGVGQTMDVLGVLPAIGAVGKGAKVLKPFVKGPASKITRPVLEGWKNITKGSIIPEYGKRWTDFTPLEKELYMNKVMAKYNSGAESSISKTPTSLTKTKLTLPNELTKHDYIGEAGGFDLGKGKQTIENLLEGSLTSENLNKVLGVNKGGDLLSDAISSTKGLGIDDFSFKGNFGDELNKARLASQTGKKSLLSSKHFPSEKTRTIQDEIVKHWDPKTESINFETLNKALIDKGFTPDDILKHITKNLQNKLGESKYANRLDYFFDRMYGNMQDLPRGHFLEPLDSKMMEGYGARLEQLLKQKESWKTAAKEGRIDASHLPKLLKSVDEKISKHVTNDPNILKSGIGKPYDAREAFKNLNFNQDGGQIVPITLPSGEVVEVDTKSQLYKDAYASGNLMTQYGDDFIAPNLPEIEITPKSSREKREEQAKRLGKYHKQWVEDHPYFSSPGRTIGSFLSIPQALATSYFAHQNTPWLAVTNDTYNPLNAFDLTGEKQALPSKYMEDTGLTDEDSWVGTAADIVLDPTNFIPASWGSKGVKTATKGAKYGYKPWKASDDIAEGVKKFATNMYDNLYNPASDFAVAGFDPFARFKAVDRQLAAIAKKGQADGLSAKQIAQKQMDEVGITSKQREAYTPIISDLLYHGIRPEGYGSEKIWQIPGNLLRAPFREGFSPVGKGARDDAWRMFLGKPQKANTFRLTDDMPTAGIYKPGEVDDMQRFGLNFYDENPQSLQEGVLEGLMGDYRNMKARPGNVKNFIEGRSIFPVDFGAGVMGGYNLRKAGPHGLEYNDIWDLKPGFLPESFTNKLGKPFLSTGKVEYKNLPEELRKMAADKYGAYSLKNMGFEDAFNKLGDLSIDAEALNKINTDPVIKQSVIDQFLKGPSPTKPSNSPNPKTKSNFGNDIPDDLFRDVFGRQKLDEAAEIKKVKDLHSKFYSKYNTPEMKKRFKKLGVNSQKLIKPKLTFDKTNSTSYLNDNININLDHAQKLVDNGTFGSLEQFYEHELAHAFQDQIANELADVKYDKALKKYKNELNEYKDSWEYKDYQNELNDYKERGQNIDWSNRDEVMNYLDSRPQEPSILKEPDLIDFRTDALTKQETVFDKKLSKLKPLDNLDSDQEKILNYFNRSNYQGKTERYAHLREMRQAMLEEGFINSIEEPISEEQVIQFMSNNFTDRISSVFAPTKENASILKDVMNSAPVIGGLVLTGAALQQEQDGGELMDLTDAEIAELRVQGYQVDIL